MVPETFDWNAPTFGLFSFPPSHCQMTFLPLTFTQRVRRNSSLSLPIFSQQLPHTRPHVIFLEDPISPDKRKYHIALLSSHSVIDSFKLFSSASFFNFFKQFLLSPQLLVSPFMKAVMSSTKTVNFKGNRLLPHSERPATQCAGASNSTLTQEMAVMVWSGSATHPSN